MNYSNTVKQIESDFAVHWLGKFAQVALAVLPSVVFSFYPIFTQAPNFIFSLLFSVIFGWLIYELAGKRITTEDEPIFSHYFAYLLGYLAINILNLSNVSSIPSNLTLTTILALQSIHSKNFGYATFGLLSSYLTMVLYFILPHSMHFAGNTSLKLYELIYVASIFLLVVFSLFKLSKAREPEKEEISYSDLAVNSIAFTLIFGFLFAGRNEFVWGIFLIVLSVVHLIMGMFFYAEFQHKRYSFVWFYLFAALGAVGTFLVTAQWKIVLCWELIALTLALLSQMPHERPIQYPAFFMSQLAFVFFLISEPFAKYFNLEFTLNPLIILVISILFYAISFNLKQKEQLETPLITTFESELALIIIAPFLFPNNVISIIWAAIGFCLIPVGFIFKDSTLRTGGIAILFITVLKVFIGDTVGLSPSYLALCLVIVALILIATSILYLRLRDKSFKPNIIVDKIHSLNIDEAIRRLDGLTKSLEEKYSNLFSNLSKQWNENLMDFSFDTLGMRILGRVRVEDTKAVLEVKIPFIAMIFKNQIINAVYKEIGNLLEQGSSKEF